MENSSPTTSAVVIIIGSPGSGKTTIAHTLGANFKKNEFIDGLGLAHAFILNSSPPMEVYMHNTSPSVCGVSSLVLRKALVFPRRLVYIITVDLSCPANLRQSTDAALSYCSLSVESACINSNFGFGTIEIETLRNNIAQYWCDASALGQISSLSHGVLSANPGVHIILSCTKSDLFETSIHNKTLTDGDADNFQQYLRLVALKYGASIIYHSKKKPESSKILRSCIASILQNHYSGDEELKMQKILLQNANVHDRDAVYVPYGWDFFGKIQLISRAFSSDNDPILEIEPNLENLLKIETKLNSKETLKKRKKENNEKIVEADPSGLFLERMAGAIGLDNNPPLVHSISIGKDQSTVLSDFFKSLLSKNASETKT